MIQRLVFLYGLTIWPVMPRLDRLLAELIVMDIFH